MNWLSKKADSDKLRIRNNINRLVSLKKEVADIANISISCQSAAFTALKQLLDEKIVQGREKVLKILSSAVSGENNQNIALDAPQRFKKIMKEATEAIDREIKKEKKELKNLNES